MPLNLIPEDDLRAALRPFRVDPEAFELEVRERLGGEATQQLDEPFARLALLPRAAAALIPLQIILGFKAKGAAPLVAPTAPLYKSLGYLAFPAISLFVLLGATIFSATKIRRLRYQQDPAIDDEQALREAISEWWRQHRAAAILVYVFTLVLMLLGVTWALFMLYIASFGLLIYVLNSFARFGLGNRQMIGRSCLAGLGLLGQMALIRPIAFQGIHFVDPSLIGAIFYGGALLLLPFVLTSSAHVDWRYEKTPRWIYAALPVQLLVALVVWLVYPSLLILAILLSAALLLWATIAWRSRLAGQRMTTGRQRTGGALFAIIVVPLLAWLLHPIYWPATPGRIKRYVESFDEAPYGAVSWWHFEIVASWAIESKLNPDLSGARHLLAKEIAGKQNPFVLGSAFRLGLVSPEQLGALRDFGARQRQLLDDPHRVLEGRPITSLGQQDWVIRASVLQDDLTPADRDYLAKRLRATLDDLPEGPYEVLDTALRATQLLDVIGRPLDPVEYRTRVHDWLRKSHSTNGIGFESAGGFKKYRNVWVGSLDATSDAVELMEIYGIPDGLDLNWVRSYLRPQPYRFGDRKWIATATLERLNRLPGVKPPTWVDVLYYERSLIAAAILVGLCVYATAISPRAEPIRSAQGSKEKLPPG